MNIKVCGITQLKQLAQLDGLNVDFAGLIFFKDSPRYMKEQITGKEIRDADFDIRKVGVFVNASYDEVAAIVDDYELDIVQLHGDENPALCKKLSGKTEVIKVFRLAPGAAIDIDKLVQPFDESADYYLFDTAGPKETFGGTGVHFDWNKLNEAKIEKPFFLSGGVGPEDVEKLHVFDHPDFYAVDVNSKFEKSPGVKDMAAILKFKQALR